MRTLSKILISLALLASGCSGQAIFWSMNTSSAGITVTGTCNVAGGSSTPATCTFSSPPAIGNSISCFANDLSHPGVYSFTDNASTPNTYTANGGIYGPGALFGSSFYQVFNSFHIAQSPTTVSVSMTDTAAAFGSFCISYTGDIGAVDGPLAGNSVTTGSSVSTSIVPVASADLAFCYVWPIGGPVTNAQGYTVISSAAPGGAILYKTLNSSGSQTVTAGFSTPGADELCETVK